MTTLVQGVFEGGCYGNFPGVFLVGRQGLGNLRAKLFFPKVVFCGRWGDLQVFHVLVCVVTKPLFFCFRSLWPRGDIQLAPFGKTQWFEEHVLNLFVFEPAIQNIANNSRSESLTSCILFGRPLV